MVVAGGYMEKRFCDRCEQEIKADGLFWDFYTRMNVLSRKDKGTALLCDKCMREFNKWKKHGKP